MLWRRRLESARRFFWVALCLSLLTIIAGTCILIQVYREGHSLRSAYAVQDLVVSRLFEWFLGIWVFIVGSCVASFLNVVAYRLPAGLPISGISFCPYCRVPIRPSDNVPVWGWLLLGGRCRACKLSISPRYPIFELIGGLLTLSVFLSTVLSHGSNLPLNPASNLPYGMPVNLYFMEDRVFYIAGLHVWLLMFLYAGALTSLGGGRLPIRVWIMGWIGIFVTVGFRPDVCILPLSTDVLVSLSDSIRASVLKTLIVGGLVAMGVAWLWRVRFDQVGWIAACGLVGLTLGWQASLWILGITAISFFLKKWLLDRSFDDAPLRYLWFATAVFLLLWHRLNDLAGIL